MKTNYYFFIVFTVLIIFSSCVGTTPKYLHAPNGLNLLQVKKKNDVKVAVNYGGTGHGKTVGGSAKQQTNGVSIQTAFAISNSLAIKTDFYKYWDKDENLNDENRNNNFQLFYKRQSAEIAIGYFKNAQKKGEVNFNFYTGIGVGNNSFDGFLKNDSAINRYYKAGYFKWFAMPSITYVQSENYSITIGYKLSVVKFNNLVTNDASLKQGIYKNFTTKNSVYGDFAIDNQFSFDNLKGYSFHATVGISSLYTTFSDFNQTPNSTMTATGKYLHNNRFGAIGVIADLNTLFAKK
jgi:hypothetical protein